MNATTFNIIIVLKNNSNKTLAWEQKLRDFIKEKQKNTKNMTIALIEEVSNQLILWIHYYSWHTNFREFRS